VDGAVLKAEDGRGSCDSILGSSYGVIDGGSALGTGSNIPSMGVGKGRGGLPMDGLNVRSGGGSNRGVSLVFLNGIKQPSKC
jgi:hypothetical protein